MQPIDKFTNIDAVYPTLEAKEEDDILDYVWQFAMIIHPAMPKEVQGLILEGSEAIPTFKERYNNRLIKMPLTYEEYKKDKEIQTALSALQLDKDKFWFAILFIKDYVDGKCWQAFEYGETPASEIKKLFQSISQYEEHPNANCQSPYRPYNISRRTDLILTGEWENHTYHRNRQCYQVHTFMLPRTFG